MIIFLKQRERQKNQRLKDSISCVLLLLISTLLIGCQSKESEILAFEGGCQGTIVEIDRLLGNLENRQEHVAPSDKALTVEGYEEDILRDTILRDINRILIKTQRYIEESKIIGILNSNITSDKKSMKSVAEACRQKMLRKTLYFFSNAKIYEAVSQLDLSESPVTTQHFFNKLLAYFRFAGANLDKEGRGRLLSQQETVQVSQDRVTNCLNNNAVSVCIGAAESKINEERKLAKILGYPNTSIKMLEQSMALDKAVVQNFIEQVDIGVRDSQRDHLAINDPSVFLKSDIDFNDFKAGVFDAVTTLFKVEFLPSNTLVEDGDGVSPQYFDVLKNGKKIGLLGISFVHTAFENNSTAFLPMKNGIQSKIDENGDIAIQQSEGMIFIQKDSDTNKGENAYKKQMDVNTANSFIHSMGRFIAHLLASEQEWQFNSGLAVEKDAEFMTGFVLQQWLKRPKLIRKVLVGKNKSRLANYQLLTDRLDFYHIKEELILAKLRLTFLNFSDGLSSSEKFSLLNQSMDSALAIYSVNLSKEKKQRLMRHVLLCHSFCYERLWSRMVAADLMTIIDQWDELDEVVIKDYVNKVLMAGASRTAEDAVNDFLKRPYSEKSFLTNISGVK
ncbi:MAG: M3 family metallopeptidase [Cellvibrionaceae bacterium]